MNEASFFARPRYYPLALMVLHSSLLFSGGCAAPNSPLQGNGLLQRVDQRPIPAHFGKLSACILVAILFPMGFWRRRLGYASALCGILCGLCVIGEVEGNRRVGHIAVRSCIIDSWTMDESMLSLWWGRGGLSLQRNIARVASRTVIESRKVEPNPMFQLLRADNVVYPFGGDQYSIQSPRPFPLSWGFQFSFHHNAFGFTDPKTAPLIWAITVPIWFLLVLLSITPAFWLRRTVRQIRRKRRGLCPQCGYDLRASTDKCPECGSSIPARTKASPSIAIEAVGKENNEEFNENPPCPPSS